VTVPGEVLDRFLAAHPALRERLAADENFESLNRGLPYVEAGWVARQLVEMHGNGDDSAIEPVLGEAERLLAEHDRAIWGVVTVGFFESLQNILGHIEDETFADYLGSEGRLAWDWLNRLWAGERPDPPYGWKVEDIG
jgi:hypothetical protein